MPHRPHRGHMFPGSVEDFGLHRIFHRLGAHRGYVRVAFGGQGALGFFVVVRLQVCHDATNPFGQAHQHSQSAHQFANVDQRHRVHTAQMVADGAAILDGDFCITRLKHFHHCLDAARIRYHPAQHAAEQLFAQRLGTGSIPQTQQALARGFMRVFFAW